MNRIRFSVLILLALVTFLGHALPARALAPAEVVEPCCAGHHVHAESRPALAAEEAPLQVADGECSRCQGSKRCSVCSGSGKNGSGDACSICSGSGKCYFCNGSGKSS